MVRPRVPRRYCPCGRRIRFANRHVCHRCAWLADVPDPDPEVEARIQAHRVRVAADLARLGQTAHPNCCGERIDDD